MNRVIEVLVYLSIYLVPLPLGVPVLPIRPLGSCGLSLPEAITFYICRLMLADD